jgi:iron complex outermembrane recepter protein
MRSCSYRFSCLNIPFLSVFLFLLPNLEVQAKEKLTSISQANHQIVIDTKRIKSQQLILTSAKDLLAQQTNITRVTGVEVNQTNKGLEVVLQTAARSQKLVPLILPEGNKLVIDLLDAALGFSISNGVTKTNPAPGIKTVNLARVDESSIRLTITGEKQAPSAEVIASNQNLILSVNPQGSSAQPPFEGKQIPDQEIEVIATGEEETNNYFVPEASSATKTDTPIRDTPQSIQVIPRRTIEDQQVTGIEQTVDNVSGVTFLGNDDNRGLNFAIRGFSNAPVLRDGFRIYGVNSLEPEVANLEQIEILKGPASILYGQVQPGGIVNLVSKQPLSEPLYDLRLQLGNRSLVSPSIDFSSPLTKDGNVSYRLNALYRNESSFRDYDQNFDRVFLAPTVAIKSKNTDLTFNLEYGRDDNPADFGTVASGQGIADVPSARITNNPDDTVEKRFLNFGYNLEHRFNDDWKIRNAFRYLGDTYDYSVLALPLDFDDQTGEVQRAWADQGNEANFLSLDTNIQGKLATGSIKHTLLLGVDLSTGQEKNFTRFDQETPAPLDIFNPDYSALPKPDSASIPIFFDNKITGDRLGIYLQDQVDLLDNLILLAGLRYDTLDQTLNERLTGLETPQEEDEFSPRLGIVYQPIKPVSLYASYSESFTPNEDTAEGGGLLEPETGKGFEVGAKGEIIPQRLSATLAYFDIAKQNVATPDPDNPFNSLASGEQKSKGVELDLTGEILPGWNVLASYAYIDAEVTKDTDLNLIGNGLAGVAEHSANLWTTYELQQGSLQGLGFSMGLNFVGERQGDLDNSFQVDDYFLTNAGVFYRRDRWQAHLNFNNIFDVDFIESVNGSGRARGIYPGEPFTVRGSIAVQF